MNPPEFTIPSASLPLSRQYTSAVSATKNAEMTWVGLASFSVALPMRCKYIYLYSLLSMNEYCVQYNLQYVLMMMMMLFCVADESLQAWRNGTRQWVGNLRNWLDFIQSVDSTFPSFNLDNLLDDIGKFEIEGDIGFIVILFFDR